MLLQIFMGQHMVTITETLILMNPVLVLHQKVLPTVYV